MIRVNIYRNANGQYKGFVVRGHADYAKEGSDIICAAVSALSTNTVNSIEKFSSDRITARTDETRGELYLKLETRKDDTSQLLIKSLALGLNAIQDKYGSKYLKILYREV